MVKEFYHLKNRNMKIKFYLFIAILFVFGTNCNRSEEPTNNEAVQQAQPTADLIQNTNPIKTYEGHINNQKEIIMTFNDSESLVTGTLIYKADGVSISVEGGYSNGQLSLKERSDGGGKAVFIGSIENGVYKGNWIASSSNEQLPFELKISEANIADFAK